MTLLNGEDVCEGALKNFDVFVVPGGSGSTEASSLGAEGATEVKRFVWNGGCYVGICAGFYLASNEPDFLGLLPVGIRDRQHWFRGETMLPIEFTEAGADVFGVSPGMANILYHNGPIVDWRPVMADPQLSKELRVLSYFRGEIVGKGGEVGIMNGAPAMVLGRYGKGLVLGISPHAEQTPPLNHILPHALRWLCANMDSATSNSGTTTVGNARSSINEKGTAKSDANQTSGFRTESSAANPLAQTAYDKANWVFNNVSVNHYRHNQVLAKDQVVQLDDGTCKANTDCSGFISYVLCSVSPRHYEPIRNMQPDANHPQAKSFAHFFGALSCTEPTGGWIRIANPRQLKRGDIIAWQKPGDLYHGSGNSGHVMIVVDPPQGVFEETVDGSAIRFAPVLVLDSSSVYHFKPEELPPNAQQDHRDGVAKGVIRLILDQDDNPIGYWEGTYWGEGQTQITSPTYSNEIFSGRMIPLEE